MKSAARPRTVRKIYVFTYLSLVLFFGTLIASAGTFFFDLTVKGQLAAQKEELANEQNAFNARDLERLRELESRIENAKRLLGTHVSVADIFTALEQATVATVQLTGAQYERNAFGGITFAVGALTDSLNDARFQRDIFASNGVLRDAGIVGPQYTTRAEQLGGGTPTTAGAGQAVIFTLAGDFEVNDIPYRSAEPAAVEEVVPPSVTDGEATAADAGTGDDASEPAPDEAAMP
jgi:hypothetical protein